MSCETRSKLLDDYFDRLLSNAEEMKILAHCRTCTECREAVTAHSRYLARLQEFRQAATLSSKLDERTSGNLSDLHVAHLRKITPVTGASRRPAAVLGRLAAAISAVGLGLTWYFQTFITEDAPAETGESGWSKVNIVINMPSDLNGARLTISLPEGLHVDGYEDMNIIAFDTDLVKGANALELPVRVDASFRQSEMQFLSATLQHGEQSRTFEFEVGVNPQLDPELLPQQDEGARNEGVHSTKQNVSRMPA